MEIPKYGDRNMENYQKLGLRGWKMIASIMGQWDKVEEKIFL